MTLPLAVLRWPAQSGINHRARAVNIRAQRTIYVIDGRGEDVVKRLSLTPLFLAAMLCNGPNVVFAQDTTPSGIPEAPIGHRQPTAGDVPGNDSIKGDALGPDDDASKKYGRALKSLPKFDVKATCRRAQPLSGEKSAFQSCIDDEVQAQKDLSRSWFSFRAASRATCTQETRIGGAPSFVELLTCLELDKQAIEAANENRKPLAVPKSPQP